VRIPGDDEIPEREAALPEHARGNPPPRSPLPDLSPAEGVAALRALADFTLVSQAEARPGVRTRPLGWGLMRSRLWHRAVREQQRIGAMSEQAADEVVTSVIDHLGHLAEKAPWFGAPGQLREAAIDETLRYAMLGDAVRSEPAQLAWARYWSASPSAGRQPDPATMRAEFESLLALEDGWLAAWEAWTRRASGTGKS
jgi:hypothetical protein